MKLENLILLPMCVYVDWKRNGTLLFRGFFSFPLSSSLSSKSFLKDCILNESHYTHIHSLTQEAEKRASLTISPYHTPTFRLKNEKLILSHLVFIVETRKVGMQHDCKYCFVHKILAIFIFSILCRDIFSRLLRFNMT